MLAARKGLPAVLRSRPMTPLAAALRDPIVLPPNRIQRFYRGGRELDAFRGDPPGPDVRPEDWVGSATATWAPLRADPSGTGLSMVDVAGRRMDLAALLREEPRALVGAAWHDRVGSSPGLLVKLLDAGQRLPVHCHPTRAAARRLLGSRFGKTEAWIVLGTRIEEPAPRVWAGFREPVQPSELRDWIDRDNAVALLASLVEYPVRPGDAFLIPGGVPHAIGAGVFLLELQEPSDYSIVAETGGFPIDAHDASLGLGWERAVGFFRTVPPGDLRQPPRPTTELDGLAVTPLLAPAADPYMRALRVEIRDVVRPVPVDPSFVVGVVLGGTGELIGPARSLPLSRGVTFALPAAAVEATRIASSDVLEIVLCLPPDPELIPPADGADPPR